VNFDVKKVQIRSDVKVGGSKISEVKVDRVAVRYRYRLPLL